MFFGTAVLWALIFSVPLGVLATIRSDTGESIGAAFGSGITNLVLLTIVDWATFFWWRPMTTFKGLIVLIFIDLVVTLIVAGATDALADGLSAATVVAGIAVFVWIILWIVLYNSGHDAYKASHIVNVTVEGQSVLPASSTSNLVVVSPDIATTKAQQAMTVGVAGARNYSTYLSLGPATLQYVTGHMWYVFPLEFDGRGDKRRLHSINPGYIMVSAEDPNAEPVGHYDGAYSMIVSLGGGQGSEPVRWAYDHGYTSYLLDDPTLEINDQGLPFYTVTLVQPQLGMTFDAPVGVLVINAHTGQIQRYALGHTPYWVDRVYSQQMAMNIVNWYGLYAHAGFQGLGSSNANRFQVSGTPVLVYTGGGHPDWRMLLTSFNSDSSVSKIVLMNSNTGAMRIYTPAEPMGIESPVYQAFDSASGTGASLIKANNYQAVDLTLHVIYGHLTWMATYEPGGSANPSFVGLGFVDAYHAQADNVAFGSNKADALQNYLTQLASESNANGNAPGQGGSYQTVSGTIAPNGVNTDISGGTEYFYISLSGDPTHVYVGTESNLGPALVVAQPGDPVDISYLQVSTGESSLTMSSFTDKNHPLSAAGS